MNDRGLFACLFVLICRLAIGGVCLSLCQSVRFMQASVPHDVTIADYTTLQCRSDLHMTDGNSPKYSTSKVVD